MARRPWPSDNLPLWIVAGIVACFFMHFSSERFRASPALAASLKAEVAPGGADPEAFDLQICNHTAAERVYVAVAYYDAPRGDWVARGWFPEAKGECHLALRRLPPPVYVYAETRDGEARWGDSAGVPFCLDGHDAFVIPQSRCQGLAARRGTQDFGLRLERFKELKTDDDPGERDRVHTWELAE